MDMSILQEYMQVGICLDLKTKRASYLNENTTVREREENKTTTSVSERGRLFSVCMRSESLLLVGRVLLSPKLPLADMA